MDTRKFNGEEQFILWGAGRWGKLLLDLFPKLNVKAFIDKNVKKQGSVIRDIEVMSYKDAKKVYPEAIIIVTMLRSCLTRQTLSGDEKVEHVDFFTINDFIPKYSYDVLNKLYTASMMLAPNNTCSLNCEGCLMYIPLNKNKVVQPLEALKRDLDLLFTTIDKTLLFCPCSGESLLHPNIIEIIEYTTEHYLESYQENVIVTNGTIVLKEDDLIRLSKCEKVVFSVSDYSDREPRLKEKLKKLLEGLEKHNIRYHLNTSSDEDLWHDVGNPTDNHNASDDELNNRYATCFKTPQGVYDGKLFYCSQEIWAHMGVDMPLYEEDYIDLDSNFDKEKLVNIVLRTPPKGHLEFCKHCKGRTY